jgi:hypothetical protein
VPIFHVERRFCGTGGTFLAEKTNAPEPPSPGAFFSLKDFEQR